MLAYRVNFFLSTVCMQGMVKTEGKTDEIFNT